MANPANGGITYSSGYFDSALKDAAVATVPIASLIMRFSLDRMSLSRADFPRPVASDVLAESVQQRRSCKSRAGVPDDRRRTGRGLQTSGTHIFSEIFGPFS